MYKLRKYQEEAKNAILDSWEQGQNKTLLVLPTGCGKTVVFSAVINNEIKKGHRVLVLAHRGELLEQASQKLKEAFDIPTALEKASSSALNDPAPVTVASIQSLSRDNRLQNYPRNYYQSIVIDEAHHCLSDSYKKVLDYFSGAKVLGVTATPDRGDLKDLGTYFDNKAYEYSLVEAITEGYLSPIKAQMIPLKLNISKVGVSNGDFIAGEVGSALEPYLEEIADQMLKYCKGRKTVVFTPLIKTSQELHKILKKKGFRAAEVNGESKDRAEILKDFNDGKYDILTNSMLLTEGWDCPSVDCIIVLRPTKIRSLYQQIVGRGLRLHPGKKELLLLDFLWLSEKHDLCKPASLVAENEKMAKQMERLIKDKEVDLLALVDKVKQDAIAERERNLRRQLEAARKNNKKEIDPIQFAISIASEKLMNYQPIFAWEKEAITTKQAEILKNNGFGRVKTKGMASAVIDNIFTRQKQGLSTPKQIRFLENLGFKKVGTWTRNQASKMIDTISKNKWKVPKGINPSKYKP